MAKIKGIFEKTPGSGVWYIRYADCAGRIRKEKAGTISTAKTLLTKRRNLSLVERKLPTVKIRTVLFSEIAGDALEYSKGNKRSSRDDISRMKRIVPIFGDREVGSIIPQEIERFLTATTKTPATFNRYRALLSMTFRRAELNGKVTTNPARFVQQKREDNGRIRFIDSIEEGKLRTYISALWPHHWPAVEIALHTGMRMGEQFTLTWDQVDFERRTITLSQTKNGRPRYIPLNDQAMAALRASYALRNDQPWVFLNRYGERLESPRTWFEKAITGSGIEGVTWHTLRHTFASRLAMAGVEPFTLQALMGHKGMAMTLRYTHLSPQHNLSAVQRLCDTQKGTDPRTGPDTTTVPQVGPVMVN